MAESLPVGRNFVSGICKFKNLKNPENLETYLKNNLGFYQPWSVQLY